MTFRVAVSGLNAAQEDLKVVGNNIANANTNGFKASRAEFSDVFPASQFGIGELATGGGVQLNAVRQQHTQGNISFTSNNLDLAINGQGFFRLSNNGEVAFSRAGAFGVDNAGFVVNADGMRLTGFQANNGELTGVLGDLTVSSEDLAPRTTGNVDLIANLNAGEDAKTGADPVLVMGPEVFDQGGAPFNPQRFESPDVQSYHHTTSFQVFDSLGTPHSATLYLRKNADNDWETQLSVDNQAFVAPAEGVNIQFDTTGAIIAPAGPPLGELNYAAIPVGTGADPLTFSLDLSQTTQFGSPFGVNSLIQDGFTTGRLTSVEVGDTGELVGRYSNGELQIMGQVALTNFANPQGLRQLGDTLWAESPDSGAALVGAPATASLGVIQSGALEESNVELTDELVKLIIAQRNFQANAQAIRTQDEVTQTIVNLR